MNTQLQEIREIQSSRLDVSAELVDYLTELQSRARDNNWAIGGVREIESYLNRLRELDRRLSMLDRSQTATAHDRDLAQLTEDIKKKIIKAKDLIAMFQIRLKGGRELIKMKLKTAAKGKGIKGYKPVTLRS